MRALPNKSNDDFIDYRTTSTVTPSPQAPTLWRSILVGKSRRHVGRCDPTATTPLQRPNLRISLVPLTRPANENTRLGPIPQRSDSIYYKDGARRTTCVFIFSQWLARFRLMRLKIRCSSLAVLRADIDAFAHDRRGPWARSSHPWSRQRYGYLRPTIRRIDRKARLEECRACRSVTGGGCCTARYSLATFTTLRWPNLC